MIINEEYNNAEYYYNCYFIYDIEKKRKELVIKLS